MFPKRVFLLLTGCLCVCLILAACATPVEPSPTPVESLPPTSTPLPEPEAAPTFVALTTARGDFFSGAGNCAACHTGLVDTAGMDYSFDRLWRSTSMANAARDPYYLATVRSETDHFPASRALIEDTCATCHLPMGRFSDTATGAAPQILDGGYTDPAHLLSALALDGVSCTVCHQIRPDNLGADASFSGGVVFDTRKPFGERELYGSFAAGELAAAMATSSGYLPVQGVHIKDSELCATCHTLFTPYVTADGTFSETLFPEQTPYIEWLNSEFATRQSCQDCHMPPAQGEVLTSSIANAKRSPVGRHEFVGGNAVLLEILKSNAAELQPTADETHFEATISLTHNLLQTQTATLQVLPAAVEDGKLTFDVLVTSQVGHKFPSSYPSRRAWLHVVVTDASGKVLFESGLLEADGSIRGNANDAETSQFEPHYDLITAPDQVQIYEPILGTDEGEVTTNLLKAATYLKDNRLLPAGFDKTAAPPEVGVSGDALTDENFLGGSDQVTYQVALDGATEGWKIVAELWYAPIGYRWARNLTEESSPEAAVFAGYLQGAPYTALLVASAEASGK